MIGIEPSSGPAWVAIAPMIQAHQRAIALRVANDKAQVVPTGVIGSANWGDKSTTTDAGEAAPRTSERGDGNGQAGLTEAERKAVEALKARDREVRDHEQAHARVGGAYASEPSYSYQTGPDGKRYAVGGEVQIDVSPVPDDPEATIAKMDVVKAAALAPAEPSSADRQVASLADAQRAQAMADLTAMRTAERRGELDRRV